MSTRDNYKQSHHSDEREEYSVRERKSSRKREENMSPNDNGRGRSRSKSVDQRDYKNSYSRREYDDRDNEEKRGGRSRQSRSESKSRRKRYSNSRSRSNSRQRYRSKSRSPYTSRRRHGTREQPKECRCVGIFGLSSKTTESELHHIFSKYGPIDKILIIYDKNTGRSRGFGFVYFFNNYDARAAKDACNDMEIDGSTIRVDFSITARAHTPTPGHYMGRPIKRYDNRRRVDDDRYGGGNRRRDDDDRYDSRRRDDDNGYHNERNRGSYRERERYSPSPKYKERRGYDRSRSRSYSRRY